MLQALFTQTRGEGLLWSRGIVKGKTMKEIEIIRYPLISGLRLFFNTLDYRTPHVHKEIEIIWIIKGKLLVRTERTEVILQQRDMAFFNSRQAHELQKVDDSCTFLCVQVSPQLLTGFCPHLNTVYITNCLPKTILSEELYHNIEHIFLSVMQHYLQQDSCYELYCVSKIQFLLYILFTNLPQYIITNEGLIEKKRREERLMRLIQFVDQNYMHKIKLADFAKQENRSASYISHFVRETLNQSFQEYVNTVRFYAACKHMSAGRLSLLDICFESGFSDYRYFSETFKKKTGVTPGVYKQMPKTDTFNEELTYHNLHTLEHFYTNEKSIELLKKIEQLIV